MWVANHFPDYQLDHEAERCLQSAAAARALERLVADAPGHVIVAGDMDADEGSDSMRFWTGRHVIGDLSVCYRSAWESVHPSERLETFTPENPYSVNPDWPFRGIDHVLIRCGDSGGPSLAIRGCRRTFDHGNAIASDHYGLAVDLAVKPDPGREDVDADGRTQSRVAGNVLGKQQRDQPLDRAGHRETRYRYPGSLEDDQGGAGEGTARPLSRSDCPALAVTRQSRPGPANRRPAARPLHRG